jgi:hypothetical protein
MVAYAYRMPAGIPGEVTRFSVGTTIEAQLQMVGNPVPAYGLPVAIDPASGGMRPLTVGDVAAAVYGVLVRPYPLQPQSAINYGQVAVGAPGVPPASGIIDILKRGYVNVLLTGVGKPAAAKGAPARVWVAAPASGEVTGGFTTDTSASGVAIPGAYFTGAADAAGNTEIAFAI